LKLYLDAKSQNTIEILKSIPDELENIEIALKFAAYLGVRVETDPPDIHRGQLGVIVGMLFLVIQKFKDGAKGPKKGLFGRKKKALTFKAENREKYEEYSKRQTRQTPRKKGKKKTPRGDKKQNPTDLSTGAVPTPSTEQSLGNGISPANPSTIKEGEEKDIVLPEYSDDDDVDLNDLDENAMLQDIIDLDKLNGLPGKAIKLNDDVFGDLEQMQNLLEDMATGFDETNDVQFELNLDDIEVDLGI